MVAWSLARFKDEVTVLGLTYHAQQRLCIISVEPRIFFPLTSRTRVRCVIVVRRFCRLRGFVVWYGLGSAGEAKSASYEFAAGVVVVTAAAVALRLTFQVVRQNTHSSVPTLYTAVST